MPPAPTKPRSVDERKLMSSRYRVIAMKLGTICGSTPVEISWSRLAPVACTPSRGPAWICSIESAKSFPSIPIECSPIARTPGSTPMEYTRTKISAKIRSGIARVNTMIPRATERTTGSRTTLDAARNPRGSASTNASAVPTKAMKNVSSVAFHTGPNSWIVGGHIRRSRFPMSSRSNTSVRGFTPISISEKTEIATKAIPTSQMTTRCTLQDAESSRSGEEAPVPAGARSCKTVILGPPAPRIHCA